MTPPAAQGACACGAVRFTTHGAPRRVALCHCRTCQKLHGAPVYAAVIFEAHQVDLQGATVRWESSPGYARLACATCGARVGGHERDELELSLLLFDAPEQFPVQYECWTRRRVAWLQPLPVPQYAGNRVADPS